jgi:hypothetical protein
MPRDIFETMPPWQLQQYFAQPVETLVSVPSAITQLLKGDPMRALFIVSVNPPQTVTTNSAVAALAMSPGTLSNNGGIALTLSLPWIAIAWNEWGPLVQQPWWGLNMGGWTGSATFSIHSVNFTRWPGDTSTPTIVEEQDARAKQGIKMVPNRNRANGKYGYRGLQSPEITDSYIAAAIQSCQRGSGRACDDYISLSPGGRWFPPNSG